MAVKEAIIVSTAKTHKKTIAGTGSITVSGKPARLLLNRRINAQSGAYAGENIAPLLQKAKKIELLLRCLLPFLAGHGIHISAQDLPAFSAQVNLIRERIEDLQDDDKLLTSALLTFYEERFRR